MGWFLGFKLHLLIHHKGQIVAFHITDGSSDARTPVEALTTRHCSPINTLIHIFPCLEIIPWHDIRLKAVQSPSPTLCPSSCPTSDLIQNSGYPLESILRIYWALIFYNVSDPATKNILYEVESVRCFTSGWRR